MKQLVVGQHCISSIDGLIYHHSVYSVNILMCISQGYDSWYQASHCLETPEEHQRLCRLISSKKYRKCHENLSLELYYTNFLLLYSAKKVSCISHWSVYRPCKERPPPFILPNANSICGQKFIEQINTTH